MWDGDALRTRPISWPAPPTALLFILLLLIHPADLRPDAGGALALYYAVAGLALPAILSTPNYPRWLAGLGATEWGIAGLAAALPIFSPDLATGPLLVSFALYAPWVWDSALWLLRRKR